MSELAFSSPLRYYPPLLPWLFFKRPSGTKLRHLTMCNPIFPYSGLFGVSKLYVTELMQQFSLQTPRSVVKSKEISSQELKDLYNLLAQSGKIIAKPEFGARSKGIKLLRKPEDISQFVEETRGKAFIVQAYIEGRELSAFLLRQPDASQLTLSELTERQKVEVVGDGKARLKDLIAQLNRGRSAKLKEVHKAELEQILPEGVRYNLAPLGTRSLGASYVPVDQQAYYLETLIQNLSNVKGLNYCRLETIVEDKTNMPYIIEINGANAEPLKAYEEPITRENFYGVYRHYLAEALKIGAEVEAQGTPPPSLTSMVKGGYIGLKQYLNA